MPFSVLWGGNDGRDGNNGRGGTCAGGVLAGDSNPAWQSSVRTAGKEASKGEHGLGSSSCSQPSATLLDATDSMVLRAGRLWRFLFNVPHFGTATRTQNIRAARTRPDTALGTPRHSCTVVNAGIPLSMRVSPSSLLLSFLSVAEVSCERGHVKADGAPACRLAGYGSTHFRRHRRCSPNGLPPPFAIPVAAHRRLCSHSNA